MYLRRARYNMVKTNFMTIKKLYGLARNSAFNINYKDLKVRISGRTKHNHNLSKLYMDICQTYNDGSPMTWGELYIFLDDRLPSLTVEL